MHKKKFFPLLVFLIGLLACTERTQSRNFLILPAQALGPSPLAMRDLQIPPDFDFEKGQIIVSRDANDLKGKSNTRSVYHLSRAMILEYVGKYKNKNNRELIHFRMLEKIIFYNMD